MVLAFALLSGGAAELLHRRETVEGMVHLGYPLYFVSIIGFWKVLEGFALLVPRFPRLKEWVHADAFFNMTGAVVSHAWCGLRVDNLASCSISRSRKGGSSQSTWSPTPSA